MCYTLQNKLISITYIKIKEGKPKKLFYQEELNII